MVRIVISLPKPLKAKLDTLRAKGFSVSGYIRSLLERELLSAPKGQKGR
jgi:metal-responsive CopG/Arc/MetJ family transcriptional regulator